ncbi:hypothetical protein QBC40DRAFT_261266 [Triangularia verruculosa]|uniref:Uncharacterized protein n=1 Tax=Triangularia verruculosa TaxID=2587418 RepID=A0AAN6XT03_9PEZI|nr:hypothetical protein QBC40DRAFT_261266 [Triangularia verruculosa]
MQLTKNVLALIALLPLTLAAPADGQLEAKFESDVSILGTVVVTSYSGDACSGSSQRVTVTDGGYRCYSTVPNKRSIGVSGSGCTVRTWSGNNCGGSGFTAPSSGCYSVSYSSVSIQC